MPYLANEEARFFFRDVDPSTKDTRVVAGCSTRFIDMKDFHRVTAIFFRTVGTGSIQQATLYSASAAAGTNITAIKSSGSTEATGLLNAATPSMSSAYSGAGIIVLEATADEIAAADPDGRFISARASFATATDEMGLLIILSEPRYGRQNMTITSNADETN